jgi:hypothetical protein
MTMRRCFFVLFALGLVALAAPARAQSPEPDVLYSRYRQFKLPFTLGPGKENLKQLYLWVSADQGKSWERAAVAAPEHDHFQYIADRDGLLWFAVQTVDKQDRVYPTNMDGAQPSRRVVVDTQPPVVTLQQLPPPKEGWVGVSWNIQDDNFDPRVPDSLRLEFKAEGAVGWTPLQLREFTKPQAYWPSDVHGPIEVRLRARDRAGNEGVNSIKFTPGEGNPGNFQPQPLDRDPSHQGGAGALDPNRKLINSTTISLNFEIKDKGPSGISSVELWFTQDGRSWNKYPLPKPAEGMEVQSPLTFKVNNEGMYGFTLVAKSGVGLGERPPQVGDQPQVWVEVDLTRPSVQLQHVIVGNGADKGKLFIHWKAYDKNLGSAPVVLSYAEKQEGPWQPIAEKNLANTGKYVWLMPPGVPYQFYVRVEATDLAGNIGEAVTPHLVRVDLSLPKVKITTVESGGR